MEFTFFVNAKRYENKKKIMRTKKYRFQRRKVNLPLKKEII